MKHADLKYLSFPLPENVMKEKWSGNFDRAREIIKQMIEKEDTLPALKARLEMELNSLDYIEDRYSVSEEEALKILRARIPDMTAEELEKLRTEDKADWMYINGKVMYIDCFSDTLYKVYPSIWNRLPEGDRSDYSAIQHIAETVSDGQKMTAHIHIRQEFRIKDEAVRPGETVFVRLPLPVERGSVTNLNVISMSASCKSMPRQSSIQPVAYFEAEAKHGQCFFVEYELDNTIVYKDLTEAKCSGGAGAKLPEEAAAYLAEELPHILFTPYLKSLCAAVTGDEKDPLRKARKIYDYITTGTDYRFVRDYCSIDNLTEYCAVNRRGDCGLQALLFITLCRIAGIPARWQSGLDAKPGDIGEHDWAMFYTDKAGWRYADLSYGGSSYIRGALKRWDFFFGNADPYRIPINEGFQKEFDIPGKYPRIDPYDNQCGEAEYADHGLKNRDVEYEYKEIEIRLSE